MRNAPVLPDPVLALAKMSFPSKAIGIAFSVQGEQKSYFYNNTVGRKIPTSIWSIAGTARQAARIKTKDRNVTTS